MITTGQQVYKVHGCSCGRTEVDLSPWESAFTSIRTVDRASRDKTKAKNKSTLILSDTYSYIRATISACCTVKWCKVYFQWSRITTVSLLGWRNNKVSQCTTLLTVIYLRSLTADNGILWWSTHKEWKCSGHGGIKVVRGGIERRKGWMLIKRHVVT